VVGGSPDNQIVGDSYCLQCDQPSYGIISGCDCCYSSEKEIET